MPLLGFNVGIELGQLCVLAVVAAALTALDAALDAAVRRARIAPSIGEWSALRLRTVGLSTIVGLVAAGWAVERRPW